MPRIVLFYTVIKTRTNWLFIALATLAMVAALAPGYDPIMDKSPGAGDYGITTIMHYALTIDPTTSLLAQSRGVGCVAACKANSRNAQEFNACRDRCLRGPFG